MFTVSSDYLFSNLTNRDALLVQVVSHQSFSDTDAAVLAVIRFKAAMQTLVTYTAIAVAIAW